MFGDPRLRWWAESQGIDVEAWERRAQTGLRALMLPVAGALQTRGGMNRAAKMAECGKLHVRTDYSDPSAKGKGKVRAVPWYCEQAMCPACAKRNSKTTARLLREFMGIRRAQLEREGATELARYAGEYRTAFCTPTQVKRGLARERCADAIDRIMGSYQKWTAARKFPKGEPRRWLPVAPVKNPGTGELEDAPARPSKSWASYQFNRFVQGGFRKLEPTWSPKGVQHRNPDGSTSVTEYDGFHVHMHCAFELRTPDEAFLEECARQGVHDVEDVWREWYLTARERLQQAWAVFSPGVSPKAWDFQPLDHDRVYQLAKYLVKPVMLDPARNGTSKVPPEDAAIELYRAIHDRNAMQPFGTWRSWKREAEEALALASSEDKDDRVIFSGPSMSNLLKYVREGKSVLLTAHIAAAGGGPHIKIEITRDAAELLASVERSDSVRRVDRMPRPRDIQPKPPDG